MAREVVGPDTLIGLSTHDPSQVAAASTSAECDYFCVGPCWPTPTKPGRTAAGLQLVRSAAKLHPDKPWFAIGGIDTQRLPEVLDAGARRIVVVRAITAAEDPRAAAERLSSALAGSH
jgi:thiamine-phosphate pyrophosphorylase